MSKAAAKRAARFGLPFFPPSKMPELETVYCKEVKIQNKQEYVICSRDDFSLLFIDKNPDRAWQELGQYFLNEVSECSSWKQEGLVRPLKTNSLSINDLREQGFYEIITPEESLQWHLEKGSEYNATLHPLGGGMRLKKVW